MTDILIILILVAFNGFFSLSEVALISARRPRLMADAKAGSRSAKMALALMDDPDKYLSTAQIGITVVSILTGIYSGERLTDDLVLWLEGWGVSTAIAPGLAKTSIVVLATYLQCELGELFPKRIGIDLADAMAKLTAPLMTLLATISLPAVWFLSKNTELLIKICRLHHQDQRVTEAEIKNVISQGVVGGEVREVEQDIMERALVMGDQRVGGIMTHRADLVVMDVAMDATEVEKVIQEHPYVAYPLVDGSLDDIVGMVSIKDLILHLHKPHFSLRKWAQQPVFFPENMTAYKALDRLRANLSGRALVCDEFGTLQGIITLKDILAALVGGIDEPEDTPYIAKRADGESWVVGGLCPLYDFLEYFDCEDYYTTAFSTVGGLILHELAHIPTEGEALHWHEFYLRVAKMDGTRIDRVTVKSNPSADAAQEK